MKLKYLFFLLIIMSFTYNSEFKTNAKLTGYDYSRCGCCGGWIVNINGERKLVQNKIPGWENKGLFSNINIVFGDTIEMPIDIYIEYTNSDFCNKIIVNYIEIIDTAYIKKNK